MSQTPLTFYVTIFCIFYLREQVHLIKKNTIIAQFFFANKTHEWTRHKNDHSIDFCSQSNRGIHEEILPKKASALLSDNNRLVEPVVTHRLQLFGTGLQCVELMNATGEFAIRECGFCLQTYEECTREEGVSL